MPAPWRRSIARWRAGNSGPACSTASAVSPASSRACARAGVRVGTTTTKRWRHRGFLDRHAHARPQSAERAVRQQDIAAVRAGDVAGDGEAKAGAAFVLVAGIIEAQE